MEYAQKDDLDMINTLASKLFPMAEVLSTARQGGMTNHTYEVKLTVGDYIFRLPGPGTENMINRYHEEISAKLAGELGIDTELFYFNAETGVKIVRYIKNAETMSPVTMRKSENVQAVAELFKKLHTCGRDTGVPFDVFAMAEGYENLIRKYQVEFYPDYVQIRRRVMDIKDKIEQKAAKKVPCHNDPLCENWVRGEGRIFLVDWEYAGMNDPMWDLSDLSIEAEYSRQLDDELLKAYLGRNVSEEEHFRFQANKIFVDFLWSLWGKARVPFGGTEMEQYAWMRYNRMKQNLSKI